MSWNIPDSRKQFLSTPSARRATGGLGPTTREPDDFYPRPPRGGRRPAHSSNTLPVQFLSTPSARRATDFYFGGDSYEQISIHALREEGDEMQERVCTVLAHFYPRPPRGGRPAQLARASAAEAISIHALREEGDLGTVAVTTGDDLFLSTPSARRATVSVQTIYHYIKFLSTPSARRATSAAVIMPTEPPYFYPRPPRGGRRCIHILHCRNIRFLSTPSARRATAKTETKSLFSNKLYNILHEFRRALIYNGSKSYPNHAK